MIKAVVFDVGETLVDETRVWGGWADWIGVPRHTLSAVAGAVAVRGGKPVEALEVLRPGFSLEVEERRRDAAGVGEWLTEADLYPDARPTLEALVADGVWVGIAANQPLRAGRALREMGLPVRMMGISAEWGVAKPEPEFFARVLAEVPYPAEQVLYVGDRVDRDVVPAQAAGMRAGWVRRGPWAMVHGQGDARPDVVLEGLGGVVEAVRGGVGHGGGGGG